jgi:monoamine oxidase
MRTAVVLRRQEEERNRRELEQKKREQERAELRKQVEAEEAKLAQLNQWVKSWEEAERLRRFIAVYAEKTKSGPPDSQPGHKAWIEWATREADRLDPFVTEKPASVLDRKHELRGW